VFTVLGGVAVQTLALSERHLRVARATRAGVGGAKAAPAATPAKRGAKGAAKGPAGTGEDDDIAAQLGVGSVSVDELDLLGAEIEGQVGRG
jgi:hypothetical protein